MGVGFDAAGHTAKVYGKHHDHRCHEQRQPCAGQIAKIAGAAWGDVVDIGSRAFAGAIHGRVRLFDGIIGRPAVARGNRPVGGEGRCLARAIFRSGLILFSGHEIAT